MQHLVRILAMTLLAVAALGACAAATPSPSAGPGDPLGETRAREMATAALRAFDAGDYAGFSADWSDAMKAAIGPDAFRSFREQMMASWGRYVSLGDLEVGPAKTQGFVSYTFAATFERGALVYRFTLPATGGKIEGATLDVAK